MIFFFSLVLKGKNFKCVYLAQYCVFYSGDMWVVLYFLRKSRVRKNENDRLDTYFWFMNYHSFSSSVNGSLWGRIQYSPLKSLKVVELIQWHSECDLFNCVDSRGVEASWHQPQVWPLSTKYWVANVQLFCSIVSCFPGSRRDMFPLGSCVFEITVLCLSLL